MAALASLTANYTDSEDDEASGQPDVDEASQDSASLPPTLADRLKDNMTPNSDTSRQSFGGSARSTPSKKMSLVSYGEDDGGGVADNSIETDPEEVKNEEDKNSEPVPMDLESEDSDKEQQSKEKAANSETSMLNRSVSAVEVDAWTDGGKLPPEAPGLCSQKIQESVNRAWRKKQECSYDMNAVIQNKKAFRNPSIYEKLIEFCDIDEHGTNFPKDLYDGHLFGKESYYDELAKVQKADMERREKAAKERSAKADSKRTAAEDLASHNKRKSKWDQVGPPTSVPVIRPTSITAAAAVAAPITAKTIPAFGALKK